MKRTTVWAHIVYRSAKAVSIFIPLFLLLFTSQALADYTYENVPTGYGLAWSDEFNGTVGSLPNSANWSYDTGSGQPNDELENYTNSTNNIHVIADPNAVDGKSLAIIALDPGGNNDAVGDYTSARIDTENKQIFTYGYMEARVRMPYGQGIWPAFWMLGNDINTAPWPACDEIDIMENIGQTSDQATNHMSLHDGNDYTTYLPLPGGQLYHNAYHTFAALWQANQIQFFVDGNLMATDTPADLNNNWAFNNNPNFFLLNCAVGGDWPGNPDATTSFPQTMLVDYVRAYQTGLATPVPVVQSTWRVRCGGDNYTDSQGNLWSADTNFTGGWPSNPTTNAISGALPASGDETLYQWERYGNTTGGQTLTYTFNVPTGSNYQVTMKFAEDYWTAAGQRLFNYAINGTTEATNFDIFANAGGQFKALDKVYSNITPNANGQIVITLSPGSADNPKVDAIQVVPMASSPTNTPTITFSPTPMATNTPTATVVANSIWRVRAGGPAYTDSQGNVWAADEDYTGGTAATGTNTIASASPSTSDQALYQDQRYGASFSYTFNVPAGSYQVLLKFAETYWTAAGDRVFNVGVNGSTVLTNFDIYATAGGQNIAVDKIFNNVSPSGGTITINLGPASADQAMITAIQIIPQASAPATSTPTKTFTATATSVPSSSRLPYQVVCYALQTTMAPANSVNDNGQGTNINWTTDVPWQDLTVVSDAFAIPSTNDTFDMTSEVKGSALITPAHANGVRCILSIGGGSQDSAFSTLCAAANREAFASAVTALVAQYGYDGVDIDWETDTNQQADATSMMEDIYTKLKALPNCSVDGKPHTLSFTTVNYISNIYNMTTLGNYTDWCFFMGYDWGACPELATGPLNAIASEIDDMTDGSQWSYPIGKMVLGCPLYCDVYDSNCDAGEYDTLSILHLGTAGTYNTSYAEQEYTYGGQTVYVDTAQSYCDKTNWAINNKLMGIGMWDMAQGLPYTDVDMAPIWKTIGAQASCLNLGPTATPTITPTPVIASTWRVDAGGAAYTDGSGNVWAADENYNGGTAAVTTSTISNTTSGTLFQSQRYGTSFSYTFNVPAGSYQVSLLFAETYFTAAGSREFNVSINGTTELTNFDIYATAGAQNKAVTEIFNSIAPTGGTITITFGPAAVNNAEIEAIQIIPMPSTPTNTPTLTATKTVTPTQTVTLTSTLTSTSTAASTSTLTNTATMGNTSTNTNTATLTSTSTLSSTVTASFTPSSTPTPLNTKTATNSPTVALTSTPTNSQTAGNTSTSTNTAVNTATSTNTVISTATKTSTALNTATRTNTALNTMTSTNTPVNTATATLTNSASPTRTWTAVYTVTNTQTVTATLTPTATVKSAPPTSTETNTPVPPTASFTPTKTATSSGACAGIPEWSGNFVAYSIGQKVQYNGEEYQCIQAHTSESTWEPNVTPALWKDLGACGSTQAPVALIAATPVVYPNPATGSTTTIALPMTTASNVSVQIFTVAMRQVQNLSVGQVNTGSVTVQLTDKGGVKLANGLYYFRVLAGGQSWTVKVLVLR